jgi:hypothetical protein
MAAVVELGSAAFFTAFFDGYYVFVESAYCGSRGGCVAINAT